MDQALIWNTAAIHQHIAAADSTETESANREPRLLLGATAYTGIGCSTPWGGMVSPPLSEDCLEEQRLVEEVVPRETRGL